MEGRAETSVQIINQGTWEKKSDTIETNSIQI